MRKSFPHYEPGFYGGNKPYRDCLVGALRYFGLTSFLEGEEFWTLGAMEWCEFHYLLEKGIVFGAGTYHNVDRGVLAGISDDRVVGHSGTEFLDIWEYWVCPRVLCFDCTEGIREGNERGWVDLVQLAIEAVRLSGRVCLNWNYMTRYGNLGHWDGLTWDELVGLYERWLSVLCDHVDCAGFGVDFYSECVLDRKEEGSTPMLSGHCLIVRGSL